MDAISEAISGFVEWVQGINLSQNFWENALWTALGAGGANAVRLCRAGFDKIRERRKNRRHTRNERKIGREADEIWDIYLKGGVLNSRQKKVLLAYYSAQLPLNVQESFQNDVLDSQKLEDLSEMLKEELVLEHD